MAKRNKLKRSLEKPTRAIVYIRVSPRSDGSGSLSLEDQRRKALQFAALYGIEIVATVEDRYESAKTLDRPGLRRVLGMLEAGEADGVIVAKLDRLTRSVRGLGELFEQYFGTGRFALCSVGEQLDTRTASGRLVANILASVAQWERETISERTSAALQVKAKRCERVGGIPFGFQLGAGGKLEPNPTERSVVKRVQDMRRNGETFRSIVATLNCEQVPARGKRWHLNSVARMLKGAEQ